MKTKPFIILIMLFILASCSSVYYAVPQPRIGSRYNGMTHRNIVSLLGAPDYLTPDGAGGYIMVYAGNRQLFKYSNDYARVARQLPTAQFYMSEEGVCESVKYTYDRRVSEYRPDMTLGLLWFLSHGR